MKLAILLLAAFGTALGSAQAQNTPPTATALCITLQGHLVLRPVCRKRETTVDATMAGAIGIKGDPSGLAVTDAGGREVGIPLNTYSYYGSSSTTVAFQATAQGDSTPSFFTATVDANGFKIPSPLASDFFSYDNNLCTGTRYLPQVLPGPNLDLYRPLTLASDGQGYFARTGDPAVHQQYFRDFVASGPTGPAAIAACANQGGTVAGVPGACPQFFRPTDVCVRCCRTGAVADATATRRVDLGALGLTPPFHLSR